VDEYDEEEWAEAVAHSAPVRKIDWLICAVGFARGLSEAVVDTLQQAEILLCGQANHDVNQAVFQDEARRQIESMTEGE
jgi:hypothetical protein